MSPPESINRRIVGLTRKATATGIFVMQDESGATVDSEEAIARLFQPVDETNLALGCGSLGLLARGR